MCRQKAGAPKYDDGSDRADDENLRPRSYASATSTVQCRWSWATISSGVIAAVCEGGSSGNESALNAPGREEDAVVERHASDNIT